VQKNEQCLNGDADSHGEKRGKMTRMLKDNERKKRMIQAHTIVPMHRQTIHMSSMGGMSMWSLGGSNWIPSGDVHSDFWILWADREDCGFFFFVRVENERERLCRSFWGVILRSHVTQSCNMTLTVHFER
jgi:hypothetical protein